MTKELTGRTVGGWNVLEYIGAGKSALVLRASKEGQIGALKIFDPELVERFGRSVQLERITRELRLRDKKHPSLITIFDGGESEGLLFVVMEYIQAPNLANVLGELPRNRIRPLISQIADAARFLANMDLVHRDIKPENILVQPDFGRATLLDLGVMRPIGDPSLTDAEDKVFVGTLRYSSPEFLLRQEQDNADGWRAVTFYQLGAVLHDMIMRVPLFAESSSPYARLVRSILQDTPKIEAPDVSPDLVLLAKNCLLKDPELRLRCVQWEGFSPPTGSASVASGAKERILRRAAVSRETQSRPEIGEERRSRMLRRAVQEKHARLESLIREHCIDSQQFPPLETREWTETEPNETFLTIRFGPSSQHSLPSLLDITFRLVLLDDMAGPVSLQSTSSVSPATDPVAAPDKTGFTTVYEGVFDDSAIRVVVESVLYTSLDQAQELGAVTKRTYMSVDLGDRSAKKG
jgi:serine/threonine protein kinase